MILLIFLLILLQRQIYRAYWDRGLDMKISFSAKEAFEGEKLVLTEELTNAKPLPLPWVTAKFQLSRNLLFLHDTHVRVSDDYYQNDLFSINMYQRITRKQEFFCGRRGYYRIKSMDLGGSNIFISEKLIKRLHCDAELTVLPRAIPFAELEIPFRQLYGDIEVRRFMNPDPFAFRGMREYQYRDDFRHINFKASAQAGQLMVNVHSATASQELVVLLNLQPYGNWTRDDVYEESIRLAASAAERFCTMGLSVGLTSNGRDIVSGSPVQILPGSGRGHLHGILEKLARIDLAAGQDPMSTQLDSLTQPEPVYLLISSYYGEDLVRAYESLLERGLQMRWILPAMADTHLRLPAHIDIFRWEVEPHDAPSRASANAAG
jgi:uncharacterized protein (DUF58 family)